MSLIQVKEPSRHQRACLLALLILSNPSCASRSPCQRGSLEDLRCPAGDIADHWCQCPALAGGCSILSTHCFLLSTSTWPLLALRCNLISLDAWGSCNRRENLLNIYRKVFCFCTTVKSHQEKILFLLVWARNLFMKLN